MFDILKYGEILSRNELYRTSFIFYLEVVCRAEGSLDKLKEKIIMFLIDYKIAKSSFEWEFFTDIVNDIDEELKTYESIF